MAYYLRRVSDGAGDSGPMSCGISYENGKRIVENNCRPRVGIEMQVGAIGSRSYSAQDYWHCTKITKIIEDTKDKVRFQTLNSEYEWGYF